MRADNERQYERAAGLVFFRTAPVGGRACDFHKQAQTTSTSNSYSARRSADSATNKYPPTQSQPHRSVGECKPALVSHQLLL